jgi:hypothetical protein
VRVFRKLNLVTEGHSGKSKNTVGELKAFFTALLMSYNICYVSFGPNLGFNKRDMGILKRYFLLLPLEQKLTVYCEFCGISKIIPCSYGPIEQTQILENY